MSKNLLHNISFRNEVTPKIKAKQQEGRLCQCSKCNRRFSSSEVEPVCPHCWSDEVDFVISGK